MAISKNVITFAPTFERFSLNRKVQISFDLPHTRPIASKLAWFSFNRKVGRVIDRAGLEIRYTPFGYRGFESLTFRKSIGGLNPSPSAKRSSTNNRGTLFLILYFLCTPIQFFAFNKAHASMALYSLIQLFTYSLWTLRFFR